MEQPLHDLGPALDKRSPAKAIIDMTDEEMNLWHQSIRPTQTPHKEQLTPPEEAVKAPEGFDPNEYT